MILRTVIVFLIISIMPTAAKSDEEYFGRYLGKVVAEWLPEGRKMKLTQDFKFEDPNGLSWDAPTNSLVDGASIPGWLWSIIGSPFSGQYRDASVIHDIACQDKKRTWEVVHLAFYYAMRTSGVGSVRAKTMYAAVYHFGPRWPVYRKVKTKIPTTVMKQTIVMRPTTVTRTMCSASPFGGPSKCYMSPKVEMVPEKIMVPEIKMVIHETSFLEPPSPYILTRSEFEKLAKVIEQSEQSGQEFSLNNIRKFQ